MIRETRAAKPLALLLVMVAACLGGCAGSRVKPVSQTRVQAMEHNRRGVEAEARGERDRALAEFSKALKLQSSVENTDGMIVALINSARTQRLKGDLSSARQSVERAASLLAEGSELASELFYEKAKILLAAGEIAAARVWAVRAEAAEKGDARGRRQNLVAALMLRQGLPDQARELLEQALQLNRKAEMAAEEANSLRLLGEIHLVQGGYDRAGACYREALKLDKEFGLGAKIAADLCGLGAVAAKRGDNSGAIGWYRRALEVSSNGGDAGSAAATMALLAQLYRLNGDQVMAEQLEAELGKIAVPGAAKVPQASPLTRP